MIILLKILGALVLLAIVVRWRIKAATQSWGVYTHLCGRVQCEVIRLRKRWWLFWWPKGRSMTLPIPTIGPIVFIHWLDSETQDELLRTLRHEAIHFFEQMATNAYVWLLKYILIPSFRFAAEVFAFKETMWAWRDEFSAILDREARKALLEQRKRILARGIASGYFLPKKYDEEFAYKALQEDAIFLAENRS